MPCVSHMFMSPAVSLKGSFLQDASRSGSQVPFNFASSNMYSNDTWNRTWDIKVGCCSCFKIEGLDLLHVYSQPESAVFCSQGMH